MLKEKRFEFILKEIGKQEIVSYEFLAAGLEVSEDTIRRDVDYLHKNGLLSKVRGGAMERAKNPLSFQDRNKYLTEEKDIIALKALKYIKSGMTIFMDGGTTICAIAKGFPVDLKIRVVTTNLMLVPILLDYKNIDLIFVGGNFNRQTASTVGHAACNGAANYNADVYFMGTCGVDADLGVSAVVQEDAEVKQIMLKNSRLTVALANHDRLNTIEPFKVCDLTSLHVLVTDLPSTDEALNDFRGKSLELV